MKIPAPPIIPDNAILNKKKYWLAIPIAATDTSPKLPTITVSTIFTKVDIKFWIIIGIHNTTKVL